MQKMQTGCCNCVLMLKHTAVTSKERKLKGREYEHLQYCSSFCEITPLYYSPVPT